MHIYNDLLQGILIMERLLLLLLSLNSYQIKVHQLFMTTQTLTKPLKKKQEVSQLMQLVLNMKAKQGIMDMLTVRVTQIMLKIWLLVQLEWTEVSWSYQQLMELCLKQENIFFCADRLELKILLSSWINVILCKMKKCTNL